MVSAHWIIGVEGTGGASYLPHGVEGGGVQGTGGASCVPHKRPASPVRLWSGPLLSKWAASFGVLLDPSGPEWTGWTASLGPPEEWTASLGRLQRTTYLPPQQRPASQQRTGPRRKGPLCDGLPLAARGPLLVDRKVSEFSRFTRQRGSKRACLRASDQSATVVGATFSF